MSERAQALADRFEQENGRLIAAIERFSDEQWRAQCSSEGWSVGVTAHHLAGSYEPIAGVIQLAANDQPLPHLTMEMLDQRNAQHAQEYAGCTREETLDLLRRGGETAARTIRELSDEQLDRTTTFPLMGDAPVSTQQMFEGALFDHFQEHSNSIWSATAQVESSAAPAVEARTTPEPPSEPPDRPWWKRLLGG
jgi:uncharacterized damage-inducible protein DinB